MVPVFLSPGLCLGKRDLVRLARVPGSEGPGCVIIDQMLRVLSCGDSRAGRGGWWVVAVVSAEALSLVLEAAVAQDGYYHYDADDQEDSNGHFHRTYAGNRAFPPQTKHILLGDAMTGLKTLLLLLEVVLVAITTTIGKAGTAFTEWVVIPAWDILLAHSCVW